MAKQKLKLAITKPYFSEREKELLVKPLETGWVVQGPYVKKFEEKIAAYIGAKYAVAVNSCTSGQFIMSRILDLKENDEVIIPAFTWISTANSVQFMGAKPIFCDIDIDTFNIDVTQIESLITERTVAIYPVALFGLPANMPEIVKIAKKYNLKIVEDCACGLGGKIDNIHCGLFSEAGILSFHPRKSITTGEGGMIFTNDESIAKLAESLRDHGAIKTDFERHHNKDSYLLTEYYRLGYNVRMTDFQGALGVAQVEKLEEILYKKQMLANEFDKRLECISYLEKPSYPTNYTHGYQAYVCIYKEKESKKAILSKDLNKINELHIERNTIMKKLEEIGIATRQGTHSVHIQKYYKELYSLKEMDFPAAYAADKLSLALPFYPTMTDGEVNFLFDELNKMELT